MPVLPSSTPATVISRVWNARIAPLSLAGSWDNVGLLLESPVPKEGARKVLLTIDLSSAVMKEALSIPQLGAVIAYHPPIFSGLKSLTLSNPLQKSLLTLAANGISVFSPHTSLDVVPGGMNDFLASAFNPLESCAPITPSSNPPKGFEGSGEGKLITLREGLSLDECVRRVKTLLGLKYLQLSRAPDGPELIKTIGICAGSGESVLKPQADLYLTGEMGHHYMLSANAKGTSVILCGHSNTERPYLSKVLKPRLDDEFANEEGGGWEFVVSQADREPFEIV